MEENDQLNFTALHVSSGSNIDTNVLLVPANATYTIENVELQNENAGTMTALECPNGGLMIAHNKPNAQNPNYDKVFSNLNAVIPAGTQCIYDRTGAGASEHTYIQIQYYPYDARVTIPPSPENQLRHNLAALSWLTFLILETVVFFSVLYFFYKRFKK